jgi:hypothetical protein
MVKDFIRKNKAKVIIVASLVIIVAGLAIYLGFFGFKDSATLRKIATKFNASKPEVSPPIYFCPLSGERVLDESLVKRRPLIVKVENSSAARPQSGLLQADIVYEMLTEGGITRFAAIYLCRKANSIGPVRSARFPDTVLVRQYNGFFGHCGGSWPVRKAIKNAGIDDLDEIRYGTQAYWRVSSRRMPHNLYTSTKALRELVNKLNLNGEINYRGFEFKGKSSTTPTVSSVTIPFSGWNKIVYKYDKETNSFLRFHRTTPHTDATTGKQISVKNVVVIFVTVRATGLRDSVGSAVLDFDLAGKGKALFYIDGREIKGSWEASFDAPPHFYRDDGKVVKLNRGNTWIEVVPLDAKVTAEPASESF